MSLPHALLTSLVERPASGLDLARRFDSSIGFFWAASHQQIYRELARMEAAGWIRSEEGEGRGGRKLHHVLPEGVVELRRWVALGGEVPPARDALLVRLRADAALGPLALADQLHHRRALHEARLAAYEVIAERDFGGEPDRQARIQRVILEAGIITERAWAQWCQDAIEALADADPTPERPGTSSP